jgi:SAM-dependent methyltransferase
MHAAALPVPSPANHHVSLPRLPSLITGALNRTSDWCWDRRLGVRTGGCRAVDFADAVRYQPLPYFAITRVLDRLELGSADVLVDVGSGKGRVVSVAARRTLRGVIGVEIDPGLHAEAEANLRRLRGVRAPVQLCRKDATTFDFAGVTAVCLCNPFGAATMATVLRRLEQSLRTHPRAVRIAYVNPVCTDQLIALPWLELVESWEMSTWSRIKTPVHFYRTRA